MICNKRVIEAIKEGREACRILGKYLDDVKELNDVGQLSGLVCERYAKQIMRAARVIDVETANEGNYQLLASEVD